MNDKVDKDNFIYFADSHSDKVEQISVNFDQYISGAGKYTNPDNPKKIKDRIKETEVIKNELLNNDLAQDIIFKKRIIYFLIILLSLESFLIYAFSFLQATKTWGFVLDEWSFRVLVGATILQTYFILRIAVEYLFPKK